MTEPIHRPRGSYPDAEELASEGTKLSVIVVDDEASARRGMELIVRDLGYACRTAADGMEALAQHRQRPADIILSDWNMPNMSGLELCRAVRRDDAHYVYFIFVTALADKQDVLLGMRTGADDYLVKPVDADQLEVRLAAAKRVLALQNALLTRNRALKRASVQNLQAARMDALTGVRNRFSLESDLELVRGSDCCLAMCDVDEFKVYNDAFGHPAGDHALRMVANVLREQLRHGDDIYRYGGEEFLVVLRGQQPASARHAMERVRRALESRAIPHAPNAKRHVLTMSIGIAPIDANAPGDWIARADAALYRAKRAGRNRIESE